MAIRPSCDADVTEWATRLERTPAANLPKVWTCPDCDVVLGVTDWGAKQ